jgi:hypothetical protein
VLAGLRLIVREPVLRVRVLAGMVSLAGVGIVDVASYPLSLDLRGGTQGYGAMTALLGGGGLIGAAVTGRALRSGPVGFLIAAFAASAAGLALAGAAPVLAVALAGMALAGRRPWTRRCRSPWAPRMGRAGIEPATLGLRVPCSTS